MYEIGHSWQHNHSKRIDDRHRDLQDSLGIFIVTNVGGLPDVVTDGKTGYVVESKNPEQIADAVIRYFKEEKEEEFAQNVKAEEYKYSWDRMTEVVEELWAR